MYAKNLCYCTDLSMEQLEFFSDLYRAGVKKEYVGLELVQSLNEERTCRVRTCTEPVIRLETCTEPE